MRFIFHRHHGSFQYASQSGAWQHLARLEIQRVTQLTVGVQLADHSSLLQAEIFREGHILYLRQDARVPRDNLCAELCVLLGARSEVADALYRIVFSDEDELEQFFEARGIERIPPDELLEVESPPTDWLDVEQAETDVVADEPAETAEFTDPVGESDPPTVPQSPMPDDRPSGARYEPASDADGTTAGYAPETSGTVTRRTRSPDRSSSTGRLLSYAEPRLPTGDAAPGNAEESSTRREVAEAAVRFVIESERAAGHEIQEMPFNNEGFDLQRCAQDGRAEYIEVKGCSGLWTEAGVVLTPKELEYAERFREKYFVYVVEFATDLERRRLFRIQNPFGKVAQFRFDSGWKGIADTADLTEPAVGLQIELPEGIGTIAEVHRAGKFFRLRVDCGEAAPRSLLFVPGKMRLRRP